MSKAVQLELVYSGGTLTFDVEGEFLPRWQPVHKLNANPPVVTEMRKVWELRQCRFVSTTSAALWTKILALEAALDARGTGHPTAARLIRDPSGAAATIITLGPATYEQFLLEAMEGETDGITPRSSWRTSATFMIRVSAVKKNAEAVTGLVGFDQQVDYSYENGLVRVGYRTQITTAETVDARTKAQTYAAIDITDFGSDYTYDTNGPYGIDYTYTDADENNARVPTVVEVESRIRQWGINVGTTGPGAYPDKVGYSTRTIVAAKKTRTEITISAEGPGYESWVTARIPTGPLSESDMFVDTANKIAVWTGAQEEEDEKQKTNGRRGESRVVITGGHRARDYEPVAGGFEPVEFVGAFAPWTATVTVLVERVGGTGKLSELKLPGKPGAPWTLIENESEEGEPFLLEESRKVDESQDTWQREARLVYRSAKPPSQSLAAEIAAVPPVSSHFYPHAS